MLSPDSIDSLITNLNQIIISDSLKKHNLDEAKIKFIKLNKVKIMRINDIRIPKEFQKPRTEKMNERIEYFKKNQNFETQIVVDKDNNLIDGYTTYLIAKKYGINFINVIKNS